MLSWITRSSSSSSALHGDGHCANTPSAASDSTVISNGKYENSLSAVLEALWADLPRLAGWNPRDGWLGPEAPAGNPFPSAYLLVLLLLASIGLIVWRRTRRLAQGFVLGAAIGLVVAGGLCLPLVSSF